MEQTSAAAGLEGAGVLVVGASSGIGRAIGELAVRAGARVVVAARRRDALDDLVAVAGGGTAVAADITDAEQCRTVAARAVDELGSIDVLVNATGVSVLRRITETSAEDWHRVLQTNVTACNQLLQAVVPHLSDAGVAAIFSSEDAGRVRGGLGAYAASKAALEASLAAWRHECAPLRFMCVTIGATMPTEVADHFDGELLTVMLDDWIRSGHLQNDAMETAALASCLLGTVAAILPHPGVGIEHIVLRSPSGVLGNAAVLRGSLQTHLDERSVPNP